ncbi:MAG: hypothetical protein KDH09_14495 [Chrysiogenetes bacterium]|nr:hypothetical protein [Chrysiogenetes bacterium]
MAGITGYGLHFAAYRLPHEKIASAWEGRSAKGEKAVACADEDALTFASDAAADLMGEADASAFGGIFFASTTSPFSEKSSAAFLAHCYRLPKGALTGDFAGTRRAASTAVKAALDAVRAGSADNIIVTAGDARTAEPGGPLEQVTGDGGAALCIGSKNVVAEILGAASVSENTYDEYRVAGDDFVNAGDQRFAMGHNFVPAVSEAITQALASAKVAAGDIAWTAIGADNAKVLAAVAKKTGLKPDSLLPAYLNEVGYLGAPQPLVTLAQALEKAKPGEKILWVAYGDGADAYVLEVTEEVKKIQGSKVEAALADKRPMKSYEKYLKFRGVFKLETPGPEETPVLHWNEREWNLPLMADKCPDCELVYFPPQALCMRCGSRAVKIRVPISRRGKIFTYTKDYLVANPDSPQMTCVVTAENGARLFLQGTDFEEADVDIDVPVEFALRRLHDGGEFPVYYWKCRPAAR